MDKGPWVVGPNDDRIDSDDFTHDASLILYGDFAPENRRPYLQFIADQLNSCMEKDSRIAALEKVVAAAKALRYEIYSDEIELDFVRQVLQFDSALRELEGK